MRVLIQRVSESKVEVNGKIAGSIDKGLLVFIGIEEPDDESDLTYLCNKIANLRIFDDEKGVMNKSVVDIEGEILVISQFTLHASTKKGNRPSYIRAAKPEHAKKMYEAFCNKLSHVINKQVARGIFGAHMMVSLVNDGPVTIWIDSKNKE